MQRHREIVEKIIYEAIENERTVIILNMLEKLKTCEEIHDLTGLPLSQIKHVKENVYRPDFTKELEVMESFIGRIFDREMERLTNNVMLVLDKKECGYIDESEEEKFNELIKKLEPEINEEVTYDLISSMLDKHVTDEELVQLIVTPLERIKQFRNKR